MPTLITCPMKIKLGCGPLDELLEGGIEKGCLTLFYGEAGSGKTNVCIQIARNVSASGQRVFFLDAEGVSAERVKQIFGANHEPLLQLVLFTDIHSFEEQERIVEKTAKLAESDVEVGLIVLDSATMHYRLTRKDEERMERKSLTNQITILLKAARLKNIPVVLTSQVYTDIDRGTYEPLGGHILLHNSKSIIKLEKIGPNLRRATLMKHRHLAEGKRAEFKITGNGLE
jgi:DNA repair protein RadB